MFRPGAENLESLQPSTVVDSGIPALPGRAAYLIGTRSLLTGARIGYGGGRVSPSELHALGINVLVVGRRG